MISQLFEIVRIESGAVPLERASVAPEVLPAATIQLVVESAPGLPELSLDRQLVGRVLDKPGDNASKFSPNGATVRLWTRLDAAPGGVLFGIADEGPGIPAEALKHLFEKFNRVPKIRGRRTGTGLGLAFCRLVVEAHSGRIWVESPPGKGSKIVARLRTSPTV
jgi:signal transduction histidine kinase